MSELGMVKVGIRKGWRDALGLDTVSFQFAAVALMCALAR